MTEVTVRELRNHGGDVIERVTRGERVTITRAGKPVAELRPLVSARVSADALVERWQYLPFVDPARFRKDGDSVVDVAL